MTLQVSTYGFIFAPLVQPTPVKLFSAFLPKAPKLNIANRFAKSTDSNSTGGSAPVTSMHWS